MLPFRDSVKSFKLDGDLLKTMTNRSFNVTHSNQQDQKLIYEFGKEMKFGNKKEWRKSPTDISLISLLNSPAIMASEISSIFTSSDPNEMCDRIKLLMQEEQAGNFSTIFNDEIIAIVGKLWDCKCICTKQHKFLVLRSLN